MSTTTTQHQIIAGKNAITEAIQAKMGTCPYYRTHEILDEVLIQKTSWGGKDIPENRIRMSPSANVEYMTYAQSVEVLSGQAPEYYQKLYADFIDPKRQRPELSEKDKLIQRIKALVALREATLVERLAMERRIAGRAKDLDTLYPIDSANKVKMLEKFRKENEPLLKEIQEEKDFSWQNLLGYGTAQMGYVQKTIIEKELETIVSKLPIWQFFGDNIPGFGVWTCAYFIAKLQDPRRFSDSGKVRGFCGMAPKNGEIMRRKAGEKVTYDPGMKEILCKILPESFIKVSARFPDEPYAKFLQECRKKQSRKAQETKPEELAAKYKVPVTNIKSLGYEEVEGKGQVFKGFSVTKENGDTITTLNPGHVFQRALREWSSVFISDFYHMWLYLLGENPRIDSNPRIMAVLEKSK